MKEIDNKPYFVGKDVAEILGYTNSRKAPSDHCRGVTKRDTLTNGGIQSLSYISEGDVYRLIVHSKLPSAQRFERWVFDEMLSSIHKYGAYMTLETIEAIADNLDLLIQLAQNPKAEREKSLQLEAKIQADVGKVQFAEAVTDSGIVILIGELAKILKRNEVDIGQN